MELIKLTYDNQSWHLPLEVDAIMQIANSRGKSVSTIWTRFNVESAESE